MGVDMKSGDTAEWKIRENGQSVGRIVLLKNSYQQSSLPFTMQSTTSANDKLIRSLHQPKTVKLQYCKWTLLKITYAGHKMRFNLPIGTIMK